MIRGLLIALILVVVLAGGAVAAWMNGWTDGLVSRWSDPTVAAVNGTIEQRVVAIGRVEPVTEVTLANKIPGRIKAVLVKEGDMVTRGQPVVRFDADEFETQVRMARTRVVTAEEDVRRAQRGLEAVRARLAEVRSGPRPQEIEAARAEVAQVRQRWENLEIERMRAKRLFEASLVARSDFDRASSEAEVARARVRSAEQTLQLLEAGPKPETVAATAAQVREAESDVKRAESQVGQARAQVEHQETLLRTTVVESTVNGKVTRKMIEPGEAVDVGAPLLVIGDVARIIVKADVDETDLGKLALGQKVDVSADAYPGRVFPGKIYELGQTVGKRRIRPDDPARMQDMKVLETKVEVLEGGQELKLGMTVDVRILVAYKEKVLVIPKRLVPPGATQATVQVAGTGGAEARVIKLGMRDDEKVEVTSGLGPGDRVVTTRAAR